MEGLSCFWAYDGIARKLIKQAKYKFYYDYLEELVNRSLSLSSSLGERPEFGYLFRFITDKPVMVPVPLYPKRERERGFNQSKMISLSLSKSLGMETADLLVRIKDTGRQVGRTREERLKAMEGAFRINSKFKSTISQIHNVLLVDDVWTTGATMNECTGVLKKAGVKRVWGLVLAR
jgi:ComF family protein